MEASVYMISGPMAAGKTTVAAALARRFERGVHLEGDIFRRSIVSGRADVTPALLPEAMAQLRLRYRLAVQAAEGYAAAGFTVAYEDVIAGDMLRDLPASITTCRCHVVVLLPTIEEVDKRARRRSQGGYGQWTVAQLHEGFTRGTPRVGLWLDTTGLSVEDTVDEILRGAPVERPPIAR